MFCLLFLAWGRGFNRERGREGKKRKGKRREGRDRVKNLLENQSEHSLNNQPRDTSKLLVCKNNSCDLKIFILIVVISMSSLSKLLILSVIAPVIISNNKHVYKNRYVRNSHENLLTVIQFWLNYFFCSMFMKQTSLVSKAFSPILNLIIRSSLLTPRCVLRPLIYLELGQEWFKANLADF